GRSGSAVKARSASTLSSAFISRPTDQRGAGWPRAAERVGLGELKTRPTVEDQIGRFGRSGVAQFIALDFAGRGLGQGLDELDPARVFPVARLGLHPLLQLLLEAVGLAVAGLLD